MNQFASNPSSSGCTERRNRECPRRDNGRKRVDRTGFRIDQTGLSRPFNRWSPIVTGTYFENYSNPTSGAAAANSQRRRGTAVEWSKTLPAVGTAAGRRAYVQTSWATLYDSPEIRSLVSYSDSARVRPTDSRGSAYRYGRGYVLANPF